VDRNNDKVFTLLYKIVYAKKNGTPLLMKFRIPS